MCLAEFAIGSYSLYHVGTSTIATKTELLGFIQSGCFFGKIQ